jgi:hypothetical protein
MYFCQMKLESVEGERERVQQDFAILRAEAMCGLVCGVPALETPALNACKPHVTANRPWLGHTKIFSTT